ncbi:nuclear pore membrane glycoprotein 210-like [Adelges cooleyi]|uniref:nuclear pore membrane glycoprotein 210-like n=1 Tax=Adelges cooleyi TaxID=133065 RepID=UPI002180210A|nr:nuclear pore membrane glycoprotein 210-like [Adelges cooleyi]
MPRAWLSFFVWTILCSQSYGLTLNVPRVWLPILNASRAAFKFETTDGTCSRWSIVKGAEAISLTPVEADPLLGCSVAATVTTLPGNSKRTISVISVTDAKTTEQVVYCQVIVNSIASLAIVTRTKELVVNNPPEFYELAAFDDQGNTFSTMNGVECQWSVQGNSHSGILRLVTFKDSSYLASPEISNLERTNRQGHVVLVEGVKPGRSELCASLVSSDMNACVQLDIIDHLVLEPEYVVILPGDQIHIKVYKLENRGSKKTEINKKLFSIEILTSAENSNVLKSLNKPGDFLGVDEGEVTLKLKDIKHDRIYTSVSSTVVVSRADHLSINLKPVNNRNLVVDNEYQMEVVMYTSAHRSINIGSNVKMEFQMDKKYFFTLSEVSNGTYNAVRTKRNGTSIIKAYLLQPLLNKGGSKYDSIEVNIHSKVVVTPKHVVFPLHKYKNDRLRLGLNAIGGDNNGYLWSSDNVQVCTVSSNGHVTPFKPGKTKAIVATRSNPLNHDHAVVRVIIPDQLKIVVQPIEQEIGRSVTVYLQLSTGNVEGEMTRVTMCNWDQFKIAISPGVEYTPHEGPFGVNDSCAAISFVVSSFGLTTVTVTFVTNNSVLRSSAVVGTYSKLEPLYPRSGLVVLGRGCESTLVFFGGPRTLSNGYRIELTTDALVNYWRLPTADQIDGNSVYAYRVKCGDKLGKAKATLAVRRVSKSMNTDAETAAVIVTKSTVEIVCSSPKSVKLTPVDMADRCPLKNSDEIIMEREQQLTVRIDVIDEKGSVFDNATGVNVSWAIKNNMMVKTLVELGTKMRVNGGFTFPDYHYTVFEGSGVAGHTTATLSVIDRAKPYTNQQNSILSSLSLAPKKKCSKPTVISKTVIIKLIDPLVFTTANVIVTYRPKMKCNFYLEKGSGYFEVWAESPNAASVVHGIRYIEVMPMVPGSLTIISRDLCFPSRTAEVLLTVRSVHRIEVILDEFIEIGREIQATVSIYDADDNILRLESDELQMIRPVYKAGIIAVHKKQLSDVKPATFVIKGVALGNTKLCFVINSYGETNIRSPHVQIHVHSPLTLSVKHLTLAVGSQYWLTALGGPQSGCVFEYTSNDHRTVETTIDGVLKANALGTATVTCTAVKLDEPTGDFCRRSIIASDFVTIKVIQLKNIKIEVPTINMKVGQTMPAWIRGVPDPLGPMIIGTMTPPLTFHWSTSIAGVVNVFDIMENSGILVREQDRISVRIRAVKKGNTVLSASVYEPSSKTHFVSSISLAVYDELSLESLEFVGNGLMIAPNTHFKLKTSNSHRVTKQSFMIVGNTMLDGEENGLNHCQNVPSVFSIDQSSGLIRSSNVLGSAHVAVLSTDDFGVKQTMTVPVQVKLVNYIMIALEVSDTPRTKYLGLKITHHDEKGVEFKAVNSDMMFTTNYRNRVKVTPGKQKNTLKVSLFESGEMMLKVWYGDSEHHSNEDYLKFSVTHLIYPNRAFVTIGDVVCFLMPVKFNREHDVTGEWKTDNPNALKVQKSSGFAVALAPSDVSVMYSSDMFKTSTSIRVLPIKSILILNTDKIKLKNSGGAVDVQLVLLNEQELAQQANKKRGNMWEHRDDDCSARNGKIEDFPFKCYISFGPLIPNDMSLPPIKRVFDVAPHFDTKTGYYSCRITPSSVNDPKTSTVQAVVQLQVTSDTAYTETKEISFAPAVAVDKSELYFGQFSGCDTLTVTGLPDVLKTVTSSNSTLVSPVVQSQCETNLVYSFTINPVFWDLGRPDVCITVTSGLTSQHIKVGHQLLSPCHH